MCISTTKLEEG